MYKELKIMTDKVEEKADEKTKDLVVFLDGIGRTIIAERNSEDDDNLRVSNPAVINIVPQQTVDPNTGEPVQRMALQLFPLFFREFLAAKDESVKFIFKKNNITLSDGDIALDFKVGVQYEQLFSAVGEINPAQAARPVQGPVQGPAPAPKPTGATKDDNVIKLFDD
jgi:hypothetical protein